MLDKLKSRKVWATVAAAAITALGAQLGIDPAVTLKISGILMLYVIGQGIADGGKDNAAKHQ